MWKIRFLLVFVVLLFCPLTVQAKGFSAIYVLGDSLSDQGNMLLTTSKIVLPATEDQNPFPIPNTVFYYEGRFTNGENYADRFAEKLNFVVLPSEEGGGNYAVGGAQVSSNILLAPFSLSTFYYPLNVQSFNFSQDHSDIPEPEALYIVFAGSNDVFGQIAVAFDTAAGGPVAALAGLDEAVDGIRQVIEAFIAAGARDILVPLVPDLGILPITKSQNPVGSTIVTDTATTFTEYFNDHVEELVKDYPRVNIMVFDTAALLRKMVADPAGYGLKNVDTPCYNEYVFTPGPNAEACDNPETYLFWDFQHPTTVVHKMLADLMLQRVIEGILTDFIDKLDQAGGLPKKTRTSLLKDLSKIQKLLIDKKQKNDEEAAKRLKALAKTLGKSARSPLVSTDINPLSARARQLAELVEAKLR